MDKTFAGISTQFSDFSEAAVLLQSIAYDGTSTLGKGADKGFSAFLEAAENLELYDIETDSEVYRNGIHITEELNNFQSPKDMFQQSYQRTKELLSHNKFLTFFGGEHSISIGVIKAFYEHYENLTVLQLDAHADLRQVYQGTPYNHACALYDASKHCKLIQVGIRSMDVSEKDQAKDQHIFYAHQLNNNLNWKDESITLMSDKVYITFDLDAFDPCIMPSTGTPEPGGLLWYPTLQYLKKVFQQKNVVGFDLVELAPIKGLHAPQFLVAKLFYKMLSYKFM